MARPQKYQNGRHKVVSPTRRSSSRAAPAFAPGAENADEGAPSRDISKIDKTVMDNFYKLVHTQPTVRLTAACSTFKIITAMKGSNSAKFNEHLNYCVERLVTGLASSRALARRGYATLLLEILKRHQVSTERLLTLGQQKYGNISNESSKDNLLGYYLLISVMLESGNHSKTKQSSIHVEKMYKILTQLIDQKSYFDFPVSKLLVDRNDVFYEHLLANIHPAAFGSDYRPNHVELLSIALCNKSKKMPQLEGLTLADILRLSDTLSGDKLKRRPLHPVWVEWSITVMSNYQKHFKDYLDKVVHPNFFKPNHNDLAAMALELTAELIRNIVTPSQVDLLLNDYIVRLLILSLRSKNALHKHSMAFFASLNEFFNNHKNSTDVSFAMAQRIIFLKFTKAPGSLMFDEDSKTQCLTNMLNNCHPRALKPLTIELTKRLDIKMSPVEAQRLQPKIAKLIAHIIRRPQMSEESEFSLWLARYLIVNSLFSYVDPLCKKKNFWEELKIMPIAEPLEHSGKLALKSAYHTTMDQIVSSSSAQQRITYLGSLVDLCHQLIQSGAVGFFDTVGDITKAWQNYMVCYLEYRKLCDANNDPKILYPISSLYLLYGLQIVEHGLNCCEQLDDLYQAAQDAIKNDPSDGSWADILTDQIISILSATECNSWIRKLCVSVFGSLLPHISETSIDLLCDVIKAPLEETSGENDDDDSSGDDMEDQDMSVEQETGIASHDGDQKVSDTDERREVEDEDNEREEDDDDVDEEEEMDFTDGSDSEAEDSQSDVEMSVKPSFGNYGNSLKSKPSANEDEEDDEEEEEYLDDEEMMKLDSVLVDMFKLNRVGKKKRRDPSFKLRCLDLVKKVLTKKHNDGEVIKKILATIIPLATKSRKSTDTRPISTKIDTMIAKMPGKSKLNIPGMCAGRNSSFCTTSTEHQQLVVAE